MSLDSYTSKDFRYTSPREKIEIVQALLKQFYEAPTRGNSGKGDIFSATMTQRDLAEALGVSIPTISRLLTDPGMPAVLERYGIAEYRDATYRGPKRWVYNPEIATIITTSTDKLTSIAEEAKALLGRSNVSSNEISSTKPDGIKLRPDQEYILQAWNEKWESVSNEVKQVIQNNIKAKVPVTFKFTPKKEGEEE